ncbi:MAG: hypothetical protein NT075_35855 [Chloroflexi bacterium]|nr:hypothetical protein [Chloroflexota bacterium]
MATKTEKDAKIIRPRKTRGAIFHTPLDFDSAFMDNPPYAVKATRQNTVTIKIIRAKHEAQLHDFFIKVGLKF